MYVTQKISGVITGVGRRTNVPGYIRTIVEPILLTEEEMDKMTEQEVANWINSNNQMMERICEVMSWHKVKSNHLK